MSNTNNNADNKEPKTSIEQEEKHQQDVTKPVTTTATNNDTDELVEQQGSLKNSK